MAVLEAINRKQAFSGGAFLNRQPPVVYDLQDAARHLALAPHNLPAAAERSRQTCALLAGQAGPALLDAQLKFPVSLATALQTAALYQRMDWAQPVTRRYLAAQFFHNYCALLLKEAVKLVITRQVGFDLAANNVVVQVLRGEPVSVQLKRFEGSVGPAFPLPGPASGFKPAATAAELYRDFTRGLLAENLKPLVAALVELSGAKAEVFWDYAIETLLEALAEIEPEPGALELARRELLAAELDPSGRLLSPPAPAPGLSAGKALGSGPVIYLKRRCCEKFKKKERCSNCPGHQRRPGLS